MKCLVRVAKQMIFSFLTDLLGNIALHWNLSNKTPLEKIVRARKKTISEHDNVLVDSTTDYLLLNTKSGLFLVSRTEAWKAKLGEEEEAIYAQAGKKSFKKIHRILK